MTHAAHALIVVLLLHNLRQFLLDVCRDEAHDHFNADVLVHDRQTPLILVARLNQGREEDLLQLLVVEV